MTERMWAIDVEGNGGSPPEIIEIAIVQLSGIELTGLNHTWRIRPQNGISPHVSRIHGIWDHDVENEPELDDVADDILMWIEGAPIVGHNVKVELDALTRSLEEWSPSSAIDTLKMSRMLLPKLEKHGLDALGKALNLKAEAEQITGATSHSALFDATLSAMVLRHLLLPLDEGARLTAIAEADLLNPRQAMLL